MLDTPKNIWFNPALNARRKAGTLTLADNVLTSVATFTANLFPAIKSDVGNRKSGVNPPEIGVNLYQQANSKRLADTSEYTFGVEITYIPADSTNRAEISHAIFQILQGLDVIQSDVGTFRCTDKNSDMTDGLGHVTANVSVWEHEVPTDTEAPIITEANQIINKTEQEVTL